MDTFRLSLLGSVEIERNKAAVRGFESRKALGLLCYLVERREPISRSHLADLFWGDKSESRGRANLSRALHNLSTLLPDAFTANRNNIQFTPPSNFWIDLDVFAELVRKDDIRSLSFATSLYHGEFLADLYIDDCPDFETWVVTKREQWRRQIARIFRRLILYHTDRGEYEQGLHFASRLLSLDPWREEGHRHMMILLAYSGQRTAALKQYETCRRILAEELGVAPASDTTELYERIRVSSLDEGQREQNTMSVLPYIGRAQEHAWLMSRWNAARAGYGMFTVVEGEAGLGKTRLIREVLHALSRSGTLTITGRCCGFGTPVPYQPITDALRETVIGSKPPATVTQALTSLNDVWLQELTQLLPEIREIKPDMHARQYIVGDTARHRLFEAVTQLLRALIGSHGAIVIFLDDIHRAEQATIDLLQYLMYRLQDEPAWFVGAYRADELSIRNSFDALLRDVRWQRKVAHLSLEPLPQEAIRDLFHTALHIRQPLVDVLTDHLTSISEGNPFLIYHIIQSMEERGALRFVNNKWEMEDERRLKEIIDTGTGSDGLSEIAQELVLQPVERLSQASRHLLNHAAVIGYSFDPILLQTLAGPTANVAEMLDTWVSHRLVSLEGESVYNFAHDIVRLAIYNRIPIWYRRQLHARVAETIEQLYDGDESQIAEQVAYHYLESDRSHRALKYLKFAAERAERSYAWELAGSYCTHALSLLNADDAEGRYDLLLRRAQLYRRSGHRDEQDKDLRELQQIADKLDSDDRRVEILSGRIDWALSIGRFTAGISLAHEAAELADRCTNPHIISECLLRGALCCSNVGDHAQAREWADRALEIYPKESEQRGRALTRGILGVINLDQGLYADAHRDLEQAVSEWRALDDTWQLAVSLSTLSTLCYRRCDYGLALLYRREAYKLASKLGDPLLEAGILNGLGLIYDALGQYDDALASYQQALDRGRSIDASKVEAAALLSRAHTLLALDKITEAEREYRESLRVQEKMDMAVLCVEALNGLADCLLLQGETEAALDVLAQATALADEADHADHSETIVRQAEVFAASGDVQQAYYTVMHLLDIIGHPSSQIEAIRASTLWRAESVMKWCGEEEIALQLGARAKQALNDQAAALTDPDVRDTFLQAALARRDMFGLPNLLMHVSSS